MVLPTFFAVLTDASTLLALATVFLVDVYTAYRAYENVIRHKLLGTPRAASSTPTERFMATHGHSLDGAWVWALPVIAACTLLLLFFLLPYLGTVLLLFSCVACGMAIVFVLLPLGTYLSHRLTRAPTDETAAAFVAPVALGVILYWLGTGSYVANNALGVALCVMFGAVCRVPTLRSLVVLMCGLFAYDVFFVFFSARFFSKNVMVEVATTASNNPAYAVASWLHLPFTPVKNLPLPAKLVFPSADGTYSILGLGDIVLPELLLVYLVKLDLDLDIPLWSGFFAHGLAAHIAALFISFFCNAAFQAAQPALFYIVPLTLGVTVVLGRRKNLLAAMWNDTVATRSYRELHNSSPEEREVVVGAAKNDNEDVAVV